MSRENIRALVIIICTVILSVLGFRVVPAGGCGCEPPQPPPHEHAPPPKPGPQPDPLNAIGKCSRPGVGCSFTVIGPRRGDGRYDVLLAAHCCDSLREKWSGRLRDGRTLGFTIVNMHRESDYAWAVTDSNVAELPYALLADGTPPVGTKVWHSGFGIHVPGNREDGTLTQTENTDGQIEFRLSVSPGDSGGGIVYDSNGKIVSTVCCTTDLGREGRVWGASPERIARGRVVMVDLDEWIPIQMPIRPKDFPVRMPQNK